MESIKKDLKKHGDAEKARLLQRFFKTGKGEYAEGDIFLGVTVPVLRKLARQSRDLKLDETLLLLRSPIHEERLLALLIMISKYEASDGPGRQNIYRLYLKHTRFINNWDLVDLSAKRIVGDFLRDKDKAPLYRLAKSDSLWERRISILATFDFIGHHRFEDAMQIAELLLLDRHDLIHKAVGWMLREVGKRDMEREERFLKKHYKKMPRTMLRYAIEKFPEQRRQAYLKGDIR